VEYAVGGGAAAALRLVVSFIARRLLEHSLCAIWERKIWERNAASSVILQGQ
jgi:hypothetical protein